MSPAERERSLSESLVQISNQARDGYAGCAIRLSGKYVVTCTHVLQAVISDDEEIVRGMIFSSYLPWYSGENKKPKLKLLDFFPVREGEVGPTDLEDLALLEIEGEDEGNYQGSIKAPKVFEEIGHYFFVKSTVGLDASEAECASVSSKKGWLTLKFKDKEQIVEQGDSGSAVWNESLNVITAMLVARKKRKGLCYAVPMYKVMKAFSGYLDPKPTLGIDFVAQDLGYLSDIKQDIVFDLQQSNVFREQIRHWCDLDGLNEDGMTNYLISQCESDDFVGLISSLRSAFDRASLQLDIDDIREQKRLMQAARGIVSKLVIFTIKQEAVLRIKKLDRQKARLLPKMAGSVAAGVAARTLGTRIEYMKHKKGCFEGDSYLSLESGFSDKEKQGGSNTATLLLKKLGEKLVPHVKCDLTNEVEKTDFINRINAKIQRARNNKDPKFQRKYFFILPLNSEKLSENHRSIIDQLSEMVRDVTFFYITSKYAHDILTVDDYEIDEALIEYFSTLNEFSEQ